MPKDPGNHPDRGKGWLQKEEECSSKSKVRHHEDLDSKPVGVRCAEKYKEQMGDVEDVQVL